MTPDQSSTHPRAGSSLVAMAEPTQQPEPITGITARINIRLDDVVQAVAAIAADEDDHNEEA